MVAVKPKPLVTMRLNGQCLSHSRTEVSVRDVRATIDEPAERGGTNLGPTPTETLMASLIGCTNVIGHKVAEKNGVRIASLDIRLEAQFDRRGVTLEEEVQVPFPSVTLIIDLVTDAGPEAVEKVKADLRRFCPLSKVMRACGTELKEIWNVKAA